MIASAPLLVVVSLLSASPANGLDAVSVRVANPLPFARTAQTVALKIPDLVKVVPALDPARVVVTDVTGKPIDSQLVDLTGDEKPDELVFQSDFAAGETRQFVVRPGDRGQPTRSEFKVYGRFVRERHDDFAWENDRVAHRMYGPDLETWKEEPLTSSGVDVWSKRVRRLVINDWYMTDDYHRDHGEGADLYSVGKSRGCGGVGVWEGNRLYVSRNFVSSRVLANGPIRLVFELRYAGWDVHGKTASETKRIILDAGQNFNRFESTFKVDGVPGPLTLGIGIAKHEGGVIKLDKNAGWLRSWEPLKDSNGHLGCAILVGSGPVVDARTTDSDQLLITNGQLNLPSVYYAGSGWDRSPDVADAEAWGKMVNAFSREVKAPLRVALGATRAAPAVAAPATTAGADRPWSARACDSVMAQMPVLTDKWSYEAGLVLKGCLQVWTASKDPKYFDYVKKSVDHLLDSSGNIPGYKVEDYNLDNINMGKVLFALLAQGDGAKQGDKEKDRYQHALLLLRSQMKTQPRTSDGGFWHKLIYPKQMWLDGIYMASPFLAQFSAVFNEPELMDEAANQILLAEKHLRDPKTGLLYHGWDETREQRWANPKTGTSSQFWGRAVGWYAMGLTDVLEQLPKNHPKREAVLAVLRRLAAAVVSVQDKNSGVWWQVLNAPGVGKNFQEASASSMFVYALTKGVKNGWLDAKKYGAAATRGYQGILATFAEADSSGHVSVKGICKVAGLGGNPYRDGSFEYYTGTEVAVNDPKGVGAFILASAARGE
jgi:rhamnogalacturonyl hydrolase YesR